MKTFPLLALASVLLGAASVAHAQLSSYVETVPITLRWNFNITGVSGTTLGPRPVVIPEGGLAAIDNPDSLRPVDRITTENGKPIVFAENGDQQFFVTQLFSDRVTRLTKQVDALSDQLENPDLTEPEIAGIEAQIDALELEIADLNRIRSGRWELTGVRAPQTSVAGVRSTPYQIFLTRIEPLAGRPSRSLLTSLELTPLASVANTTETLTDGRATAASGKVTTHFALGLNAEVDATTTWLAQGSGYMNYSVRITRGAVAADRAVLPTKITATGTGSWTKIMEFASFGGTAPFKILIGEPKLQSREFFPEFGLR
ncbi:MAG: hypothetical protein MUE42_10315 [Opitutaceae bacterium]|nr:hypothetical protein [Opitutaceae bacterium]